MSQNLSAQAGRSRRITSVRQLELLVDFMERHKDLALGRLQSKEARAVASRLWNECATICNAEGTYRKPKEWSRYWNDFKGRVKSKLRTICQSGDGNGGGPAIDVSLSPIEDRVAAILVRDVVTPLQGAQQNPLLSQNTTANEASPQQPQELSINMSEIKIELEQDSTDQIPIPDSPVSRQMSGTDDHDTPQDSAPQLEPAESEPRPRRSRRKPRVHARHRSLLTQQAEESLDESRSALARLQEAKLAVQTKQMEIEIRKVEALQQIALAINRLADAVSSTFDPAGSSTQHGHHTQNRPQISSSDDSDY
ncbi:nuclear apoptosis-inducing factor 1 isoform X1 [Amyelois transitella]|uniref:nuclear apoptosis-inducing factor 1 isoform X1 n=1 Tax=Amyelois transitella TaxID=680683 RepID=UPI00298FCBC3|nr:nuclear apoptosis-inducing factor 1 isoform X1 [Amyelois transitella]XP_060809235.1 nuclear apoptosis-inducing factor 1 isoform X1 [Amyelois transitella]